MVRSLLLTGISSLLLTSGAFAQESESTSIQSESRMEISDVKPDFSNSHVNVQLGTSGLGYTGDNSNSRSDAGMSAAITGELGNKARFLEVGIMYYQSKGEAKNISGTRNVELDNSYIAIPLTAKGYTNGGSDGFFIKGGMITSFLTSSSSEANVRKVDLIGTLGLGGKIEMNQKSDFIIEGSYNRGFLDQLPGTGDTFQQGFLLMGGISIKI